MEFKIFIARIFTKEHHIHALSHISRSKMKRGCDAWIGVGMPLTLPTTHVLNHIKVFHAIMIGKHWFSSGSLWQAKTDCDEAEAHMALSLAWKGLSKFRQKQHWCLSVLDRLVMLRILNALILVYFPCNTRICFRKLLDQALHNDCAYLQL